MAKVEAPNKAYEGPGPGDAVFKDGVAEVTDEAALNYYRQAGYAIDGDTADQADEAEPVDARDAGIERIGTPLRDAAVDPEPGDHLPPAGAGAADPHGTDVVAPGIQPTLKAPGRNAPKSAWVDWAVHNGLSNDEASDLTKDDLIQQFG